MFFLVDENLPASVGAIFAGRGWDVELISDSHELRGKPDEAVFEYAAKRKAVIVTRDVRFANPTRFALDRLHGVVVLRFPNEVSIFALCKETSRLVSGLEAGDFHKLVIIEPGSVRVRPLS